MNFTTGELFPAEVAGPDLVANPLHQVLSEFKEFGKDTVLLEMPSGTGRSIPVYVNEFWTSKQRAGHSLHEVSYRACFKPQLPRFFIDRLTSVGDRVYDPFMGRGTTLVEAALRDRIPLGCDINPLSEHFIRPRLEPPELSEIAQRLNEMVLEGPIDYPDELLVFYHPETLCQISHLRETLDQRERDGQTDGIDRWIRMVATNRLTGHSPGFFSVYTLPPNQAVSIISQHKINEKRDQTPPERDVRAIILKKSKQLLKGFNRAEESCLLKRGKNAQLVTGSCDDTPEIESNSVQLVVTSPPFLNVVNYQTDNWLRCWFNSIDAAEVPIWQVGKPAKWQARMTEVFHELKRVLKPGGHIAFEVGEVLKGKLNLETLVVPAAEEAGLHVELILINDQVFTKTANCWGVDNLSRGTNTNRIVLLKKV